MAIREHRSALALAFLLAGSSALHIVKPAPFDDMIPPVLPGRPNQWTRGSAGLEFGVAVLLAVPTTRRVGALAAAGLLVGVFPANVQMTVNSVRRRRPVREQLVSVLRLPLQYPLIWWALSIADQAAPRRVASASTK